MKIVPLGSNVVVRCLSTEAKTDGGLVLPENSRREYLEGRVLSVGDGRLLADGSHAKQQVQDGDHVLFDRFAGVEVIVNGEKLLILNEDEILAVKS